MKYTSLSLLFTIIILFTINSSDSIKEEYLSIRKSVKPDTAISKAIKKFNTNKSDIPKQTVIRFPEFNVTIFDFMGYQIDDYSDEVIGIESAYGELIGYETNTPYIKAKKDTLLLYETLDERINHNLLKIKSDNTADHFKVHMGYIGSVYELFQREGMTSEALNKAYENSFRKKELTKMLPLKDSAKYYYRALPHTADVELITVKDGKTIRLSKQNSKSLRETEAQFFKREFKKIKKKYTMHDTLVYIDSELPETATLTKNTKLFNYIYDSYMFKIEHYRNKTKKATKYIVISIMYGC